MIDREGKLVYRGAIDDKPTTRIGDVAAARAYLVEALEAAMADKPAPTAATQPYRISRIMEMAREIAASSWPAMASNLDLRRRLATARIWSITATAGRPWHETETVIGGWGFAADERGTTTTVRRSRFSVSCVSTTHGLVFLISAP